MKAFIHPSFWSDPQIEEQDSNIKLAALWLITNQKTSCIGICESSSRRFAFETGLCEEGLQRAIEALPDMFVKIGSSIFIRNFIRHQFGCGESLMRNNFFKTMQSHFLGMPEEIQGEILNEYPEFSETIKGFTRALKGLDKPKVRKGKEREGKDEDKMPTKTKGKADSEFEVIEYIISLGLPKSDGSYLWNSWEAGGWKRGAGPLKDWRAAARAWKQAGYFPSQKAAQSLAPQKRATCL